MFISLFNGFIIMYRGYYMVARRYEFYIYERAVIFKSV